MSKPESGYTKIEKVDYEPGSSMAECVKRLLSTKKKEPLVNTTSSYSDSLIVETANILILEFSTSELSSVWMELGREILTEDKWTYWDRIVPMRLSDSYNGVELGYCLDIVNVLNTSGSFENAGRIMAETHRNGGIFFELVLSMVRTFASDDGGYKFAMYLRGRV